jgi:PEP-CTERM motif
MIRCMKNRWLLAGLCCLTAMFIGLRDAEAGSSSITITGGYKPGGGEPPFDYTFQVYLDAPSSTGTNTFQNGDSFTIDVLPGIHNAQVPSVTIPLQWSLFSLTDETPPSSAPYAADVQFKYEGTSPYTVSTPPGGRVYLGQFEITSTYDFPTGVVPYPSGTVLDYTYSIDGQTQTGGGSFQIFSVPEPSSLILLATGAAVLPLTWLRQRLRRTPKQVTC